MARFTVPRVGQVARPEAKGFDASIGDLLVRLFISPQHEYQRVAAQAAPSRLSTAENPEDFAEEFAKTFSRIDFSGGEGLDFAHQRDNEPRDGSRYWDSEGVDITVTPGQPAELKLLHETSEIFSFTETFPSMLLLDGKLFWSEGSNNVEVSSNPLATTPTSAGETVGVAADVADLTSLGEEVYAAFTSAGDIYKRTGGGSWAAWNTTAVGVTRIWGAKGRILGSDGTSLYETVAGTDYATPGTALLHTLPTGRTWTDVADAGAAILATADDGYVYAFAEEAGALELKAQTLFETETPASIVAAQGFTFIATTQPSGAGGTITRWWRAQLSQAFTLEGAQVLRQWGDTDTTWDLSPSQMATDRDHCYIVVRDPDTNTKAYAWRYDFVTAAVSRDALFTTAANKAPLGLLVADERLFYSNNADGIWREDTTYVASGWVVLPAVDFFDSRPKHWISARLTTAEIAGTESAKLAYSTDPDDLTDGGGASWIEHITVSSGTGGIETAFASVTSRYMVLRVELLASNDQTVSPGVRSAAVRGYPDTEDVILTLPVNVSDEIERPNRRRLRVKGHGLAMWNEVKKKEGEPVLVEVFRTDEEVRGIVEQVELPIRLVSERGSLTEVANVRIRGVKLGVGGVVEGGVKSSLGRLGVDRLGETA